MVVPEPYQGPTRRPLIWDPCGSSQKCRNLIKKPWAFIRVPYMNPTILGGL